MRLYCQHCRRKSKVAEESTAVVDVPDGFHELWWTCPRCSADGTVNLDWADVLTSDRRSFTDVVEIVALLTYLGCRREDMSDVDDELERLTRRPT